MTINEVAELAFVSRSVVSRVLNEHPNVSTEARERVLKVIEEHNYRPNCMARSLATDRSFEICILSFQWRGNRLANGYWPLLHSGICEHAIARGYFVSLSIVSEELKEEVITRLIGEKRFDGFILVTENVSGLVADAVRDQDLPAVLIGHHPKYSDLTSVDVDNYQGAYEATAHLCGVGCTHVAAILGNPDLQESQARREGYEDALEAHGHQVDPRWVATGEYSQKCSFEIVRQWIETGCCPDGIFCASDTMAMGALAMLRSAGIAVPDDVALVGFDNLPMSEYTTPPLTTVHQPIFEKGGAAADLLIDEIEGHCEAGIKKSLSPELLIRQSCGSR